MKKIISVFLSLIICISSLSISSTAFAGDGLLKVTYFYVGNADSAFIQFPDGETMLIDAGLPDYSDNVVNYIKSTGTDTISYVVETHPHFDHIGGMVKILDNFEIGAYYRPDTITKTQTFENTVKKLEEINKNPIYLKKGMEIDDSEEYDIKCLSPSKINPFDEELYKTERAEMDSKINDNSVVLKVKYKNNSFLFTGDIERTVESELIANYGAELKCDVLKVPHHGSVTSSTQDFLNAVSPAYSVVSCGIENEYGHPHNATLKKLVNIKTHIYRTDLSGNITFTSNGAEIKTDATECNLPATARKIGAISTSYNNISFNWDYDPEAAGYEIYRSTGGAYTKIAAVSKDVISYTDYNLPQGGKYYYKVKSFNDYSTSDYSNFMYAFTKLPAARLTATRNGPQSVKLSWNFVENCKGYYIYRATSKKGSYRKIATITNPYTLTYKNYKLTTGKTYYYKIIAYGNYSQCNSGYSNITSAKPAPLEPKSLKLKKKSKTSIKVSWKKVSGASGYVVYRATSKKGKYKRVATTKKTSLTNKGLKKKKTYYYKVRAYKTVKGKKYYGSYSTVKKLKLK